MRHYKTILQVLAQGEILEVNESGKVLLISRGDYEISFDGTNYVDGVSEFPPSSTTNVSWLWIEAGTRFWVKGGLSFGGSGITAYVFHTN